MAQHGYLRDDARARERESRSSLDDQYRSWRDRQMQSIDRDYEEYCREREQQFHREFDAWRQNRQERRAGDEDQGELILSQRPKVADGSPDPISEATLGTNNAANVGTGRGKR